MSAAPHPESEATVAVTVLAHKKLAGWPADPGKHHHHEGPEIQVCSLLAVLAQRFDTDAHFQPCVPLAAAYPQARRLRKHALEPEHVATVGGGIRMTALVLDVDDQVAHAENVDARPEWLEETQAKIDVLCAEHPCLFYRTKRGFRLVWALPDTFTLQRPEDRTGWQELYLAWGSHLRARYGLVFDETCSDCTRLFRLPLVMRDGVPQIGAVRGRLTEWVCPQEVFERANKAAERNARQQGTADLARAREIATSAPPSIDGQGGDAALFDVARDLVRGLHFGASEVDLDALEAVLVDCFNPRCAPPWESHRLRYKLEQARDRSTREWGYLAKARVVVSTNEHSITNQVIDQLRAHSTFYTTNHRLGEILNEVSEHYTGPVVRAVPDARVRDEISRLCSFVRMKKNKEGESIESPAHVPDWLVKAVSQRGQWGIRPLVGILESPSIDARGRIIQDTGYDAATGYVLSPSASFARVPESPTQGDAERALGALTDVFCDFPFVSPADAMVPIAAVLGLIGRPAILGAMPAFLFDASTAGSGKGLTANAVSLIARGRVASPVTFPRSEDELEKVLSSYALCGASLIMFDNLTGPFCGAPLDKVLTAADTVDLRILGKTEQRTLKWRAQICATGNNLQTDGDTTRRCLRARIEPSVERPEQRTGFKHYPLVPWLHENRARLVVAALTLLRAHALAGRPSAVAPWGSFEEFTSVVLDAIVWAGGADPTATRAELLETADHDADRVRVLVDGWRRHDPERKGLTVRQLLEKSATDFELRGVLKELDKDFDAERLAKKLHKFKGRIVDGYRLRPLDKGMHGRPWVAAPVAGP